MAIDIIRNMNYLCGQVDKIPPANSRDQVQLWVQEDPTCFGKLRSIL